MDFKGKVVIVTGAAGAGIGQGVARRFAKAGANVIVADAHEKRSIATGEDIAKSTGTRTIGLRCDVSNVSDVNTMVKRAMDDFGRIDVLVNNAGVELEKRTVWEMGDETWSRVIDVNLKGAFNCCRAVAPIMIKQKKGRIVNFGSPSAWRGATDDTAAYSAAKAGVFALTRVMATEIAKYGVTVNAIAPGGIYNEFYGRDPEKKEFWMTTIKNSILVGRLGTADDIANAVMFFAADESDYITGEIITVSGGRHMRAA